MSDTDRRAAALEAYEEAAQGAAEMEEAAIDLLEVRAKEKADAGDGPAAGDGAALALLSVARRLEALTVLLVELIPDAGGGS